MTGPEFLSFERNNEARHQLWDGEVFAMSGASRAHVLLVGNLLVELKRQIGDRACEVYSNDMRVEIRSTGAFTYPDLAMVCSQPEFLDAANDTLRNPVVIVEVLSDSTEAFDRGRKFRAYQTIESLQHYVLVSQHERLVEVMTRQAGAWVMRSYRSGEPVVLAPPGLQLDVDGLYRGVPLTPEPPVPA
jgi:Uma2 family endonuclease